MSATLQGPYGRIPLGTNPLTIGYTSDNRLVVNNAQISLVAATVMASGQGYTITAVHDAHPVIVNGQRLVPYQGHWLYPGASIWIGETLFTYEENQPVQQIPPPVSLPEANPYASDINDAATVIATAGAGDGQAGTSQAVASGEAASVEQNVPVAVAPPPPANSSSSGAQWPHYGVPGNNLYAAPLTPVSPAFTQSPGGTVSLGGPGNAAVSGQQKSKQDPLKLALIGLVVALVLVAGGSGVFIYQLTRP